MRAFGESQFFTLLLADDLCSERPRKAYGIYTLTWLQKGFLGQLLENIYTSPTGNGGWRLLGT